MYTPTLGEVHTAIRTKNRKQAAEMLETLLQQKPTAEAWYLAAKLTNDRNKKIEYLRTAIFLNSRHQKSRDYLHQLGEDVSGTHQLITQNFVNVLQEQADKSPLLRKFPPVVQKVIGVGLLVLMIALVVMLISALMALRGPALSADGPTTPVVEFYTASQVLDDFSRGELDIMIVKQSRNDVIGKDIIQLDVRDVGNRSRMVEIFVYDNVKSILSDSDTLAVYEQATNVLAYSNIILTYPLDMSDITSTQIADIFDSIQS